MGEIFIDSLSLAALLFVAIFNSILYFMHLAELMMPN